MEHIFAIGDIHGCHEKLMHLLTQLPVHPVRDTVIFLGDYIDRGPDSRKVIEHLIAFKAAYPRTVFLKGNHEQMLEEYLGGEDPMPYLANGGNRTLANYAIGAEGKFFLPGTHRAFFQNLALYHETKDFIFVHAGLRAGIPLPDQEVEDLLWIREKFIYSNADFGKRVIFGHTPFADPLELPNKIGIDTGAVYGNFLTCIQLPEAVFFKA